MSILWSFQRNEEIHHNIFFFHLISTAPNVYKTTSDYVTGLYNPQVTPRSIKKDAGTSMHRELDPNVSEE